MRIVRREWIKEGKPQDKNEEVLRQTEELATHEQRSPKRQKSLSNNQLCSTTPFADNVDDDDLYSATPRNPNHGIDLASMDDFKESLFLSENEAASQLSEDGLDALLAEDNQNLIRRNPDHRWHPAPEGRNQTLEADFEDEMEAMADMDAMW